jgi:hypothetical protein
MYRDQDDEPIIMNEDDREERDEYRHANADQQYYEYMDADGAGDTTDGAGKPLTLAEEKALLKQKLLS